MEETFAWNLDPIHLLDTTFLLGFDPDYAANLDGSVLPDTERIGFAEQSGKCGGV